MHKNGIISSAVMAMLLVPAYASAEVATNHWYDPFTQGQVSAQLGAYNADQGTAQEIPIEGLIGNYYSVTSGHKTNALLGLGYYLPGQEYSNFNLAYGLNAFYLFQNSVTGNITQENLFTNLAYSYNIANLPIYAVAKALFKLRDNRFNVTLNAGLGANFITTSSYNETPLDNLTLPDNAFKGTTNTEFSAMAGIGLRVNHFIGKLPLELDYQWFYLGQGQLNATNSLYQSNLKTGKNYAQALVCAISF